MRVLVCLISQQHIPNLLSVHHLKPNILILIETPFMKKQGTAHHFLNALTAGGLNFSEKSNVIISELAHEDSIHATNQLLGDIYTRLSDLNTQLEWYINLTGGTKPMSIGAYHFFADRTESTPEFVYVNFSKPQYLLRLSHNNDGTPERSEMTYQPSIPEFLSGYGFSVYSSKIDLQNARDKARRWWDCARVLAIYEQSAWNKNRVSVMSNEARATITNTFDLSRPLENDEREFLKGGWLEVFFFGLLERHKDVLSVWDTSIGMKIHSSQQSENEYDVCFIHKYNFCSIECKTGNRSSPQITKDLYKINATMQQFRALRLRSFLATTSEKIFIDNGINDKQVSRAKALNITLIPRHTIQELATHYQDEAVVMRVFG